MARDTQKVISTGSDTSCLGNWVWTRYWEKHNIKLRVITAYIPCITNNSGAQTTYRQHQRYLDRTKDDISPRHSILENIYTDIAQWSELGDQIVSKIGLNEKITPETVTEIFENVGLTEAITHHHCDTGMVTMYQSQSHPIDGIYTSSTLQVSSGGYIPFVIISSYHRLLWLKNEFDYAFGAKVDTLMPHTVRRLKFQEPTL